MQLSGADIVVEYLKAEGVTHVFGVVGSSILDLMDAIARSPEIRYIQSQHEQAAAYMADGYARVTGQPGVCVATVGPGATNLIGGVAQSAPDRRRRAPQRGVRQHAAEAAHSLRGPLHRGPDCTCPTWPRWPGRSGPTGSGWKSRPELIPAYRRALASKRPALVDVVIGNDWEEMEAPTKLRVVDRY